MVIRAVFFDFYSVWLPDIFQEYLDLGRQAGTVPGFDIEAIVEEYFKGKVTVDDVAEALRMQLQRTDIDAEQFRLSESSISPVVTDFMRNLHGHFLKLGVLADLGTQEYKLLTDFNAHNELLEVIAGPLALGLDMPLLTQEVFAKALQAIGEPPKSCLVVSGHERYRTFAESLGIRALPFNGLPALQQTLDQLLASDLPE